ncbi:MAG: NAD(P)-dependent oxidoreductase [Deltaproteobacteria bacterium]|nr:NAD(P)-dependent oxidoreductase [Deltaproteobacteria bacterium]
MILIAGGSGFFGFNVARCLAERGEETLLVQRHPIQAPPLLEPYWGKQVRQAAGDILDLSFVLGLVKEFSIESIIHAAHGTAGVREEYGYDPPLHQPIAVQVQGTLNCLEAGRIMDLRRVTFVSSVVVYRGWPKDCDIWHEDAYLPPVSFAEIGNKKKAVEQLLLLYVKKYGLSVVSIREGHNYGPACDWHSINTMIRNAVAGVPSDFRGIRSNLRRHTVYAKDSGEGTCMIHLAKSLDHYIYNLSDGENPTMEEIAQAIKELVPGAEIHLGPPAKEKTKNVPVSMERMKEEFGFIPYDVKKGVAAFIDFIQSGKY